jgi:RimJ/RimL family protein N-acetyltransferase
MLAFTPITQHKPGLIASLLQESYAEILAAEKRYWRQEEVNWQQFDRDVFENPDTIGRCVFITTWENRPIGLGSFDPRPKPEFGIIGHNCIVPQFRGRGFGNQQVFEMLSRLRALQIKRVIATTSEHPFFQPAQRMYLSCHFEETKRSIGGLDPRYRLIEYSRKL